MASFKVEKYVPTINSILRVSDLSTISAKRIRKALAQEFPNDQVAQNKSILDKRIMECFSAIQKEREGPSSEDEAPRPSKDLLKSDFLNPSSPPQKRKLNSSPPVPSKKVRASSPTRPKPPKSNVKVEHDSDEDAKFAAELDQALNSGSMRKTRGAASGTRSKPRTKKTKNEDGDVPKKKRAPNPNSAFHAPMLLSPQLTDVVFETQLSRPMVVKKIWEYIRGHDLQNPAKRQEILCDDKLFAIFNVDKIHMFTMNKILSQHMWSKADIVGGDGSTTRVKRSHSPVSRPSPKRNGSKRELSDAIVKSDSDNESEADSLVNASDESRFSDSEEDR